MTAKNKGGRPPKFKTEYIGQVEKLCRLGATEADVADFLEVSTVTIWRWKNENEKFCNALKVGKGVSDDRVKMSLYHRAVGYTHEDVHITNYLGEITQTPIKKHYPPDPTSGIFWLKNRLPDEFREKRELEVNADALIEKMKEIADRLPN